MCTLKRPIWLFVLEHLVRGVPEDSVDKKNVYRKDMLFLITCLQNRTAVDGILRLQTDWS